jgi:multidrug resistance efflux pump
MKVKKGQLVCELDPARIKDQQARQRTKTRAAEVAYGNARLTREVAEIAVTEYTEGIFKQDMQTVLGELNRSSRPFFDVSSTMLKD